MIRVFKGNLVIQDAMNSKVSVDSPVSLALSMLNNTEGLMII